MNKEKFLKISKKIIQILMIFQILIGIIFIKRNINYMPTYGDTKEFLEISQTLELASYRPFVYPYMLNIAGKIADLLSVNITYIAYSLQSIINLFACLILVGTIKNIFNIKLSKKEFLLYSLFIFTIPFNLHFNMSIKCDSLATSFTILFICYLMKYIRTEKYRYAIYTLIAMFLASNTRSERMYFLSFVLIGIIIINFIIYLFNRKTDKINIKKILILFAILILGILTTNIAKGILQNKDEADSAESTIILYAYERIIGNTLPDIYEYLPDNVKQTISYEDAVVSASNKNYCKIPYQTLLKEDGDLHRVKEILKVAIKKNSPKVILNIFGDFSKNMLSPYYIIFDTSDEMYVYTVSRMEGEHHLYTDCYILYFNITFILITIYALINKGYKITKYEELSVIILYALVSGGFFACLTSFNFHIRYAMPVYVIEIAIITVLLAGNRENQEMEISERRTKN